jgi:hypothetical protein
VSTPLQCLLINSVDLLTPMITVTGITTKLF